MNQFSGKQFKGAMRARRARKRFEADERAAYGEKYLREQGVIIGTGDPSTVKLLESVFTQPEGSQHV